VIDVSLVAATKMPIDLNGDLLLIKDAQGHTLAQEKIINNRVSFSVNLPLIKSGLKFSLPARGEEWPLEGISSVVLNIADPLILPTETKKTYSLPE
jgi:hypothetical protein